MTQKVEEKKATKLVVAIVHAGHGTSYASGTEQPIIIATRAAKEAKRTWGRTYKFPKETIFRASVYDVTGTEKWNYDADNRSGWRGQCNIPARPEAELSNLTHDVIELVRQSFPDSPGDLATFRWAVTHEAAQAELDWFCEHALPHFGTLLKSTK